MVILAMFLVCSFISIVIPLSVFLSYEDTPKSTVVESMCTCDCWDGLYKVPFFFPFPRLFFLSSLISLGLIRESMAGGPTSTGRSSGTWSGAPTSFSW